MYLEQESQLLSDFNEIRKLSQNYQNIAELCFRISDFHKAIEYYEKVIIISKNYNYFDLLSFSYQQIATCLEEIDEYCSLLIRGIEKHKKELDGLINKYAKNWRLERMPIVDRNILKISIFELKHLEEVPVSVAINEAVEMAKIYGTENSSRFINGILGQVARDMEENGPKDGQPLAEKSILGKGKQGEKNEE